MYSTVSISLYTPVQSVMLDVVDVRFGLPHPAAAAAVADAVPSSSLCLIASICRRKRSSIIDVLIIT